MTGTDVLLSSSLLSDLSRFLAHPVIKIESVPAEEIVVLQARIQQLENEKVELERKYDKLFFLYRSEVDINLRLQDVCKANGIKWR